MRPDQHDTTEYEGTQPRTYPGLGTYEVELQASAHIDALPIDDEDIAQVAKQERARKARGIGFAPLMDELEEEA
ncbi:MAG TPA: hypothetical protein VM715_06535 [Candidatus Acidoferrum sp.]|nr:hypothetical protein [Candidatus Acidoferrum sp.]